MVIANIVTKREARKRIKSNLPTFGVVFDTSEIIYVDLLDKEMAKAFFDRFPSRIDGIFYASDIYKFSSRKNVSIVPGKYLVHDCKLKQVKTTRTFYKYYLHSEDEYWGSILGDANYKYAGKN